MGRQRSAPRRDKAQGACTPCACWRAGCACSGKLRCNSARLRGYALCTADECTAECTREEVTPWVRPSCSPEPCCWWPARPACCCPAWCHTCANTARVPTTEGDQRHGLKAVAANRVSPGVAGAPSIGYPSQLPFSKGRSPALWPRRNRHQAGLAPWHAPGFSPRASNAVEAPPIPVLLPMTDPCGMGGA